MPRGSVLAAAANMAVGDCNSAGQEIVSEGIEWSFEADAVGAIDMYDERTWSRSWG